VRQTDRQTGGGCDRRTDGQEAGATDGQTDGRRVSQTDRQTRGGCARHSNLIFLDLVLEDEDGIGKRQARGLLGLTPDEKNNRSVVAGCELLADYGTGFVVSFTTVRPIASRQTDRRTNR
jgi:hypothetical protein